MLLELTCSTIRENYDFVELFHPTVKPFYYLLEKYIDSILVLLKAIGHENHRMDATFLPGTICIKGDLVVRPIRRLYLILGFGGDLLSEDYLNDNFVRIILDTLVPS